MATENKKMKDPAEAALTAVEQALNLDEVINLRPSERPDAGRPDDPKLPDIDDHDFIRGTFADIEANAPRDRYNTREARRQPAFRLPCSRPHRRRQRRPPECRQRCCRRCRSVLRAGAYNVATLLSLLWIGRRRLLALFPGHHNAGAAAGDLHARAAGGRRLWCWSPPSCSSTSPRCSPCARRR